MEALRNFTMKTLARDYLENVISKLNAETGTKLVLTPTQVAHLLDVNVTTGYQLTKQRGFPRVIIGRRILVPVIPFLEWLERQAAVNE